MAKLGGSTATRTVTLQNKTLTSPAINGTVTTTGLTMPGHTVGGYLVLFNTDTDGTVEGALWFDESEKKVKFFNGTTVETITSA